VNRWGICYVLIAIGDVDNKCEPADLETVRSIAAERLPFTVTAIDGDAADAVTVTLLRNAGAL
jgi:hypothetical protein